jgi:hypothetical protein
MAELKYTRKIDDEVDEHVYEHHPSLESLRETQRLEAVNLRTGRYWWFGTFIGAAIIYVILQKLGAENWPRFAVAVPVVVGGGIIGVVTGMYAEQIERTVRNIAVGMLAITVCAWLFHVI